MPHKTKRILITAGGTGGHIYPAQALAQQLAKLAYVPEVLFAAGGLSTNSYFDRTQFPFKEVPCGTLSRNPLMLIRNSSKMLKGIYQSWQILNQFKPHVVVGFGSYYTIPILVAAKLKGIPIVLHEANSIPGKANKWFAPFAKYIGVHFPFTASLLKGEVVEVGIPLRDGYANSGIDKISAMDFFQLYNTKLTLLIFGGSQGAKAVNTLLKETLPYLQHLPLQFIHLTGSEEKIEDMEALYKKYQIQACIKPFEKNMHLAWKAADLFIGRSGASTIGEAMEFEVPGILIPYPFATDKHQDKNADFFVNNVGGGVKLKQEGLKGSQLAEELKKLVSDKNIESKRKAIQSYKRRPRLDLCQLVLKAIK